MWTYLKGELEAGMEQFIPLCKGNTWAGKITGLSHRKNKN